MRYDFDRVIDRRQTNCVKWDLNRPLFGREDVLDMWVADMDFPAPEPVVEAIRKRAEHPVYGYSFPPDSLYGAIVERLDRYYGWRIKPEWVVFTAGVVNGLYSAVRAFARPGDEVIIQPPVYYPFFGAVKDNGGQLLHNQLRFDGRRYTMDLDGLRELFAAKADFPARTPRVKALILCSPHNPVGRVWSHAELTELSRICLENGCPVLSDEIHCDLLLEGVRHTVTATVSEEIERNTLTFMSASKTFNLAGLSTSFMVIPNDRWRRDFVTSRNGDNGGNLFGYAALEAAYRQGDEYLAQLRRYITANVRYFTDYVRTRIPRVGVVEPEGTYLVWVDLRELGLDPQALQRLMREAGRLALDDGFAFGPGGEGFQRFNLACPRATVEEALGRLAKAVGSL
ncbi:MAG TPA: PatB family C-S lyase [Bacillota bacterium]